MNEQQLAAVKQALEALKRMKRYGDTFAYRSSEQNPYEQVCEAITALQSIISQDALYKMAEDSRTSGLRLDDWDKIGCINHDCDQCKAVQEPEIDLRKQWPMNGWKENKPAAQKPWIGLTDDELRALCDEFWLYPRKLLQAIEAKLKEKNHDQ